MIDKVLPLARPVLTGLAAVLGLIVFTAMLVLARQPAVKPLSVDEPDALSRTRSVLRNSVPDTLHLVTHKTVALTSDDLSTIAHYALSRRGLRGAAKFSIRDARLRMQMSVKLPWDWANLYVNVRLIADDAKPVAVIRQLKVGRLAIPHPLIGWLASGFLKHGPFTRYARVAEDSIQAVRVGGGRLSILFDWNQTALARVGDFVTDLGMRERLLVYQRRLAEVVSNPSTKRYIRLANLMQPLFELALVRSEDNHEPVDENRAVILVLNAYVNGRELIPPESGTGAVPEIARRLPLLNRRVDTAQHFVISAALAVSGTRTLADVAAMAKEINDTHSGSGFSFTDLAADTAGASFGKFAVHSVDAARNLQVKLAESADESRFMPSIKDLPEHMGSDEFERRFGSIDSAAFDEVSRQIQARIAALVIYRF